MTEAVDAQNISAGYGQERVLLGISFSVQGGEFFIIIGPNGSGKTTLMKILTGLHRADSGGVLINGRSVADYRRSDLARKMAFVPQQVPLDFPFLVKDVVLFGRSPHLGTFGLESARDRKIALQAMEFTEVDHLSERRIDQLSGGERQRVFIARAICQEPEIMLLDEPTAALDISHQLKVMDLMEKMKLEKQITVLMVSHDVNLAAMYADTLLLINRGRIVESGPPATVLTYETLEEAYDCPLLVDESPLGSMPRVTPVPGRYIWEDFKKFAR